VVHFELLNPRAGVPLSPLLRLSRALHGADDLERVLDRVREVLTETTRYRWTYVHLFHPSGTKMEIVGWVLPQADKIRASLELVDVSRDPFLQRVLHTQQMLVVPDLRLVPDADQAQVEAAGIRSAIAAPMFDEDLHIGPLVVCTFRDEGVIEPTPAELELISQVAAIVGTVIGRLRARGAQMDAEARLARAAKAEALGRMAGEVAHDFNNVLLVIAANLELARGELDRHPAISYLDDALEAAKSATALTRQLLASSHDQQVVERACKLVAPTLAPTQTFERSLSTDELTVLGDSDLLERVFVNLFSNARDAIGPNGRVSVEVRTVRVDGEYVAAREELRTGQYALVTVSDDGVGMDERTLARAFDPFFTTKPPERGSGLGLSVVQGITQQHDGYVNVYSKVGAGTSFHVYLPLADQTAPRSHAPTA
jgi:signal transduction histidine kinase